MARGRYKPAAGEALRMLTDMLGRGNPVSMPLMRAAAHVTAADVVATADFPAVALAAMDGVAVAHDGRQQPVLTGSPVPAGTHHVVMEEELAADGREPFRPAVAGQHVQGPGSEVRAGEVLVPAGTVLGPAELTALAFNGLAEVLVVRAPKVAVVLYGDGPHGRPAATWLAATLAGAGARVEPPVTLLAVDRLRDVARGVDLVILASDGAPGRYRELRALYDEPRGPADVLFWKMDLHPARHVGAAVVAGTPVLICPDLLYKTVLTVAWWWPALRSHWFRCAPAEVTARLAESVTVPGPFPYVLAVRLVPSDGLLMAHPVDACEPFSARTTAGLDGLVRMDGARQEREAAVTVTLLRETACPGNPGRA